VVDITLSSGSSLDLLADLRDSMGKAIPVVVFSAQGVNLACDTKVQAAMAKSRTSIDSLVATVRERLESRPLRVSREII
jgi:hypothetical protein